MELSEEELFFFLNNTNDMMESSESPEPEPLSIKVALSIVYSVIFIVGILGNVTTCVVIVRNRYMHTATNFYLISLAISDLLLLLCGLPLELYQIWSPFFYPLSEELCITLGFVSEMSANATVLIITAFTVERYIAICHPFMCHAMSRLSRAIRFILAIWICALLMAVPEAMQFGVVIDNGSNVSACTVKGLGIHQVFVTSSFIFFAVPMSVITVLYALIAVNLHYSKPIHRNSASQKNVIKMLVLAIIAVAVALSFFVCWAPFHVQRLIAIYGKNLEHPTHTYYKVYLVLTNMSGILYYLSTIINPFLYNIMSKKFRNAFKVTLSSGCSRGRPQLERTYSEFLAFKKRRAAVRVKQRQGQPPIFSRKFTASSQTAAPPRAQSYQQQNVSFVTEKPGPSWQWSQRMTECPDSFATPRSISNSSLIELDQEVNREELKTFVYEVNLDIKIT